MVIRGRGLVAVCVARGLGGLGLLRERWGGRHLVQRLSNTTLMFYGLTDLPVMLAIMPMSIWLSRFYTGDMGLGLSAVANIMLLAGCSTSSPTRW